MVRASALLGLVSVAACGPKAAPPAVPVPQGACSELARAVYSWEREGIDACQTTPSIERELVPLGNGLVYALQADLGLGQTYRMTADKPLGAGPIEDRMDGQPSPWSILLYPLGNRRMLQADPILTGYHVFALVDDATDEQVFGPYFASPTWTEPFWGHELLALDDGYIMKWWLGTGDYTVLQYDLAHETVQPLAPTSFSGTRPELERGARVLNLGAHRLLTWTPATGAYEVWSYRFAAGAAEIFDPTPVAQGTWTDPGPGDDVVVNDVDASVSPTGRALLIWTRATGRVRTRVLDASAADPTSGASIGDAVYPELAQPDWVAPTRSSIKKAVFVLQQGRTFDSYFGQYCTAPAGSAPTCETGPSCCEGAPASIPGAAACLPLDTSVDAFTPDATIPCMTAKIDGGKMDSFADASSPAGCGDPRAFVCAGTGAAAGGVATYQALAAGGALADRAFQSSLDPSAPDEIIYLNKTGSGLSISTESGTQLSGLISNARVRWALYLDDPSTVMSKYLQSPPRFYDPHWTFFRSLDELQRDVHLGQLPDLSIVLSRAHETEAPGDGPADAGITFVKGVVDLVTSSPVYANDALIVVTHLTSGGFYDHVPPPPTLPAAIDSSGEANGQPIGTPYGPRVPFLALGPFARAGAVSHTPLELSSLTVFTEWNWLADGEVGVLGHRDRVAANLGGLLDATKTGVPVPSTALTAP
jgi:hypothetical protein